MRTMKLKLFILCIFVCCFVCMTASPAEAISILYQSANTVIYLGEPYGSLEFENPLAGTEMIKEYAVIEWLDADYDAGPPKWYDDWSVNDPLGIDGYANEIWMRWGGHSIWTSSTIPSKTVSIHLHGDNNDGLADVLVDGILVARLDMGTPYPAVDNALIIVKDLAHITHHIRVNDLGPGPNTNGDDVATMGAAALEQRFKWRQPPIPTDPQNLYYGWNEVSDYNGLQIVADDWECVNDDPITDIHWWGSFKGWKNPDYPPATESPTSFHITIWNDIPANPAEPNSFSHPNEVVWETDCHNFTTKFVGWDYDPLTNCFETCFYYEQDLTEAEYFYQEPSSAGTSAIYWISIAAKYPDGSIVQHPWGWKVRPHWFNDDAVIIRKPTMPHFGDKYQDGKPIYRPDETRSWDMAFELTSRMTLTANKWEHLPNEELPGLHCHDYVNLLGTQEWTTIADDWICDGGAVTEIHWWGNYELDAAQNEMRGSEIDKFHLSIHIPDPTVNCLPEQNEIFGFDVPLGDVTVIDTGMVNNENSKIYRYEYVLPTPFPQELDQHYWLDITAFANDPQDPPRWRWQESKRDIRANITLCPAAKRTEPPVPGPWQTIVWTLFDPERYSEMAFRILSTGFGQSYVKWHQPPEPYEPKVFDGWNELSVYTWNQIVADDWYCDTDNPVTDIHWWGSYIGWSCEDQPPVIPDSFHIAIWTDVPAGVDEHFSHPGVVIWETDCNNFTVKFAGWDIDPREPNALPDTCFKFEQDLPEEKWFKQKSGGNIYWISIAAKYTSGTTTDHPWGWKTRRHNPDSLAPDDAVRIFNPTDPKWGSGYILGAAEPIWYPTQAESWDMAFELTTKEIPPKPPVPHLKWSQPPIEIDPNSEEPVYSGWDEISYIDQIDTTIDPFVADDYRCLGIMPVTSIHWWGSHYGLVEPGTSPLVKPIGWKIGFWSNVPKSAAADFSHPEKMLWEVKVPAERVEVEEVGTDYYHHYYPNDVTYQYTLHLDGPNEVFKQGNYLNNTKDDVFWLSIAAIYSPDILDIEHPWGWKTRPWSWMDDAVRFTYPGSLEPGIVLDPVDITPIIDPHYFESFDLAFELDTDPNYIKWEQPFTGIRRWPHYEDVNSMARVVTTTENVTKWIQKPDLTENGVDVDATNAPQIVPPPYEAQLLADDFECVTADTIDDIHVWGSWMGDNLPGYDNPDPAAVDFTLSIHKDIPAVPGDPASYSMPGEMVWSEDFPAGDFTVDLLPTTAEESYYVPCADDFIPNNHYRVYRYNFFPTDPFPQEGSEENPIIYWLDVQARPLTQNPEARFGWKTRDRDDGHFMDDAVWVADVEPYNGDEWRELRYPQTHPYEGASMDLAFELTSNVVTTDFIVSQLVADDWECKGKAPVTDAVWWGSYIKYQYKPCHGQIMELPVKPDFFWLAIWTDVPADSTSPVPFSHPNEIIWEYRAYDYDEVLVGYDKHPHAIAGAAFAREPVFRYSVRLPKEKWFFQKDVNDIYWFSVVAAYDSNTPNYDWGWTNHKHVFNDDAVAGSYDPAADVWSWIDLHDQLGDSEDMSFMLFNGSCWACPGFSKGDGNCDCMVNISDLLLVKISWFKTYPDPAYNLCADFNKDGTVNIQDLLQVKIHWFQNVCP